MNAMRARRKWRCWHHFLTAIKADLDGLRGVILYDSGPAGMTARESLQQAISGLDGGHRHPPTMWKFDMLRLPALRNSAAHDIRSADVVCIAMRGVDGLPGAVRTCLEKGLGLNGALARPGERASQRDALRPAPGGVEQSTAYYLRTIARCARAEIFVDCGSVMAETYWIIPQAGRDTTTTRVERRNPKARAEVSGNATTGQ